MQCTGKVFQTISCRRKTRERDKASEQWRKVAAAAEFGSGVLCSNFSSLVVSIRCVFLTFFDSDPDISLFVFVLATKCTTSAHSHES